MLSAFDIAPRQVKWRSWSCDGCWPRGTRTKPGARLGHDPEALHQLRVTARRIDATLGLFKRQLPMALLCTRARPPNPYWRTLGAAAANLDVQLAELARYCAGLSEHERTAAEPLKARLRRSGRARARAWSGRSTPTAHRAWLEALSLASAQSLGRQRGVRRPCDGGHAGTRTLPLSANSESPSAGCVPSPRWRTYQPFAAAQSSCATRSIRRAGMFGQARGRDAQSVAPPAGQTRPHTQDAYMSRIALRPSAADPAKRAAARNAVPDGAPGRAPRPARPRRRARPSPAPGAGPKASAGERCAQSSRNSPIPAGEANNGAPAQPTHAHDAAMAPPAWGLCREPEPRRSSIDGQRTRAWSCCRPTRHRPRTQRQALADDARGPLSPQGAARARRRRWD